MEKKDPNSRRPSRVTAQLTPVSTKTTKTAKTRHVFASPRVDSTAKAGQTLHKPGVGGKRGSLDRSVSMKHTLQPLLVPRFRDRIGSVSHATPSALWNNGVLTSRSGTICITTCYSQSQVGTVNRKPKPSNQDSVFYFHGICPSADFSALGVCDGHGSVGHLASTFISKRLPTLIKSSSLQKAGKGGDMWTTVLVESYSQCNRELLSQDFDTETTGSTCVTVVICNGQLICANVGDSRAVLARKNGAAFIALQLSRDHKPDLSDEQARILGFGGRIAPIMDEEGRAIGPMRVWFKSEDVPGLAMSRSLGDSMAARLGVVAEPGKLHSELMSMYLSHEDSFVIVASDGIWEFLSNEEAVSMVADCVSAGEAEHCCERLIAEASSRWEKSEGSTDDITVIVAFLG